MFQSNPLSKPCFRDFFHFFVLFEVDFGIRLRLDVVFHHAKCQAVVVVALGGLEFDLEAGVVVHGAAKCFILGGAKGGRFLVKRLADGDGLVDGVNLNAGLHV